MKEIRCTTCNKKLMNADIKQGSIEVKCSKCKQITKVSVPYQDRLNLKKK